MVDRVIEVLKATPLYTAANVRVPPTEVIPALADAGSRAGKLLGFDAGGQPTLYAQSFPSANPLFGTRQTKTGAYTVVNADKGNMFMLGGNASFNLTLGATSGYDADFSIVVANTDTYPGGRRKQIVMSGVSNLNLWPGQWCYVFRDGSVWRTNPNFQRWIMRDNVSPTWNVDASLGNDANDGLATGSGGAFRTLGGAIAVTKSQVDYRSVGPLIQLAPGTYTGGQLEAYAWTGGVALTIRGVGVSGNPAAYIIAAPAGQACFECREPQTVVIFEGVRFTGTSTSTCIGASQGCVMDINNCQFGAFTAGTLVSASELAMVNIYQPHITGNCAVAFSASDYAYIVLSGVVSVDPGLNFSAAFLICQNAVFRASSMTTNYAPGSTGKKYINTEHGLLGLGTGVPDALPGNIAGTTDSTSITN
jgi:hypothetical protein